MENVRFLEAVSLFADLPSAVKGTLASKMQELRFERGRLICEENTRGDALFVIKSGIVQIYLGEGPEKKVLAYLKRGDYFGEMAIFTGDPRSASAQAIADVTLLGLTKADFETEVQANPSIALELLKTLSRRLAQANLRSGSVQDRTGRILFLAGSGKGAGKTAVAREVAAGLASLTEGRVALLDPNVQNPSVAAACGVHDPCDLAKELASSDHVTIERYMAETPWGFSVLRPQRNERSTYPLKESHHHILVNALLDHFDYLVVDSSSTMASLNKHLMQAASRILVVLGATQESLTGFLDPFERLVLEVNQVDRRKLLYVLNHNGEATGDVTSRLGRWAKEIHLELPFDAEAHAAAADREGPAIDVAPESPWAKAAEELARVLYLDHSLEVFLPVEEGCEDPSRLPEPVASITQRARERFLEIFDGPPEQELVTLDDGDGAPARALRLGTRVTEDTLTASMDGFLSMANDARDGLGLPSLLVKVDGRPSLI